MARQPSPMLILSYDDGPKEDYSAAFPVHQRFGVPAELNIVADLVGAPRFLSADQIAEMERAGFEIGSHTCSHKTLVSLPLARRGCAGDERLYMRKASRLTDTECRVRHEDTAEVVRTLGKGQDSSGPYVALAAPLRHHYPQGTTVRLTEAAAEHEVAHSRRALVTLGFSVVNFTYPFCEWDRKSRRLVAAHYASARGCGHVALNLWQETDPYALHAMSYMSLSERQLTDLLDDTVNRRALLILLTHTWGLFSPRKLEFLLREALHRGIQVATRRDALATLQSACSR